DDSPHAIGKQQLGMKLQSSEFVHLHANIVEQSQSSDSFAELFLLEVVWWAGQDVYLHTSLVGADQPFDNHLVLVAFVLHPQRMFRFIYKLTNALAAVPGAPDQMRVLCWIERVAVPVGLKAPNNLPHSIATLCARH